MLAKLDRLWVAVWVRGLAAALLSPSKTPLTARRPLLTPHAPCPLTTTATTMRVPEPPYPSFALIMVTAYPMFAPILYPPSRSDNVEGSDDGGPDDDDESETSTFTSYGEERRRSHSYSDVVMVGVSAMSVPLAHVADALSCSGLSTTGTTAFRPLAG
jgi:hypothetical protein